MQRLKSLLALSSVVMVAVAAMPAQTEAMTIHVSPQGNDRWSGRFELPNAQRTDGPVATLERARDIIRARKVMATIGESIHVVVADGRSEERRVGKECCA